MKRITLTRGKVALVDNEDFLRVSDFKWSAANCGGKWYAGAYVRGERRWTHMHRVIMNPPKGLVVDHINGNGLDNRRANLRVVTHRENIWNRAGSNLNSKSGIRCVSWDSRARRWVIDMRLTRHFKNKAEAAALVRAVVKITRGY